MVLGFLGFPNSGKTTVYNAMTGLETETGYIHRSDINKAVVEILDERVEKLVEIYQPKKITFPSVEVYDFAKGEDEDTKEVFNSVEAKLLDVIGLVVRCFEDAVIDEELGKAKPLKDVYRFESEFILSDLIIAEKRLEKINMNLKRGVRSALAEAEKKLLEKVANGLHDELPVRKMQLDKEERRLIKGFQFLSSKPLFIVLNTDEANLSTTNQVQKDILAEGLSSVVVLGKYEMELNNLDDNDASLFLQEAGFYRFAKERIFDVAYKALQYIQFYTVGKQEVRSWMIQEGLLAPQAAGKIHTDMENGFIRAECYHFDDIISYKNERALKDAGKFRLEGKAYQVKDGDILIIRFNK